MKGTNPTKADKHLWDKLAGIGCIACLQDGIYTPEVSIHHIAGRTAPGAHQKVLPICYFHHQSGSTAAPSIHPWKSRFIDKYGSQESLLDKCKKLLEI